VDAPQVAGAVIEKSDHFGRIYQVARGISRFVLSGKNVSPTA
jgi:hypothetical protein